MTSLLSADSITEAIEMLRPFSGNGQILPVVDERFRIDGAFCVSGGEECKTLMQVERLWRWMQERGATRSSLLVAVGGGSVTDMAGFAAACFKRGMAVVNIPTTILGAVDAAIGGKTAINFKGLKNEIGAFHEPSAVVFVPTLWRTLSYTQLASGYGEVLKTALLRCTEAVSDALLAGQRLADGAEDPISVEMVRDCARFKLHVVEQDPYDNGLRRQLNLGHTFGHAIESRGFDCGRPICHGHAVAIGLVAAAALSALRAGFDSRWVDTIASAVREIFPSYTIDCKDVDAMLPKIAHDKKNTTSKEPLFVLLSAPGRPLIDVPVSDDDIRASFDIARDLLQ